MISKNMVSLLGVGRVPSGTPPSDLEKVALEFTRDMGLQVHLVDPTDIPLRGQEGEFVFSSPAFSEYLDRVGNNERTRAVFKRALEQPSTDPRYTRMYDAVVSLIQSLNTIGSSANGRLHRELVGYVVGNDSITLYAGTNPTLTRENLDETPRVAVRLKTRR